jgi:hypothetical protein
MTPETPGTLRPGGRSSGLNPREWAATGIADDQAKRRRWKSFSRRGVEKAYDDDKVHT